MRALAFLESPAPPRLPVTIVTGFLGSGKTTLVNHILANQQGLRTAVIVNDLSDVDGEAARDQLIYGHVILLNKCDLVGTERLCALEEAIGNVAARARITRTTRCNVPLAPILRLGCFNRNGFSPITRPMLPHSPTLAQLVTDGFESLSFQSDRAFGVHEFQKFQEALPENVYRAKGLFATFGESWT